MPGAMLCKGPLHSMAPGIFAPTAVNEHDRTALRVLRVNVFSTTSDHRLYYLSIQLLAASVLLIKDQLTSGRCKQAYMRTLFFSVLLFSITALYSASEH